MNAYGVQCLVSMVLGLAMGASGAVGADDYEHFVGRYAYEATPHWVEFEITRTGDVFAVRMSEGSQDVATKPFGLVLESEDVAIGVEGMAEDGRGRPFALEIRRRGGRHGAGDHEKQEERDAVLHAGH